MTKVNSSFCILDHIPSPLAYARTLLLEIFHLASLHLYHLLDHKIRPRRSFIRERGLLKTQWTAFFCPSHPLLSKTSHQLFLITFLYLLNSLLPDRLLSSLSSLLTFMLANTMIIFLSLSFSVFQQKLNTSTFLKQFFSFSKTGHSYHLFFSVPVCLL